MGKWLSRGLVFAGLMVVVRLAQGTLVNQFQTQAVLISIALCTAFALLALLWGWIDGRNDARANPDPDRREDLAMTWLLVFLPAVLGVAIGRWLVDRGATEIVRHGHAHDDSYERTDTDVFAAVRDETT